MDTTRAEAQRQTDPRKRATGPAEATAVGVDLCVARETGNGAELRVEPSVAGSGSLSGITADA